jgi:hypothetical protein
MRTILILPEGSGVDCVRAARRRLPARRLPDAVAACKAGFADKEAILGGNLIKLLRLPA